MLSISSFSGSLTEALEAAGSAEATIYVDQTVVVTQDAEIPFHISIEFAQGGRLDVVAGVTSTIKGEVPAGLHRIIAGRSKVRKHKIARTSTVFPEWWGAKGDWSHSGTSSTTDDTDSIQRAIDFFDGSVGGDSGGAPCFRAAAHRCEGSLTLNDGIRLMGTSRSGYGQAGTVLRHDPAVPTAWCVAP